MPREGQWSGLLVDLVHLLVRRLVHFSIIPVGTFSSKVTKLLTCKAGSVVESIRVCCWRVGRFYFALIRQWLQRSRSGILLGGIVIALFWQNVLPKQGNNNAPQQNPAPAPLQPLPNECKVEPANPPAANPNAFNNRPCFACQQFGHFARECPNRDNAKVYKPANQQVNQVNQQAAPLPFPRHSSSQVVPTNTVVSTSAELVAFCVNCAQTGHSMSSCSTTTVPEEQV